jgi:hypothetical protein
MKPCETGKGVLLRLLPSSYAANAKARTGRSWYTDETYIKVAGK